MAPGPNTPTTWLSRTLSSAIVSLFSGQGLAVGLPFGRGNKLAPVPASRIFVRRYCDWSRLALLGHCAIATSGVIEGGAGQRRCDAEVPSLGIQAHRRFLVPVPDGVDPAEAVCIPLAYLTAFQMLTRYRRLLPGATILVIGASGTVGTALLDLARHFGLKAIGTCSAANLPVVESFGATAIDYRAGDFVAAVRRLTAGRKGGAGVDAAFDAIGGAHFSRSFACLAAGGLLVGYGSQTMAVGREGLASAALGLARIKLWGALSSLFGGRRAVFYSITARRLAHPEEFKADMATLFACCAMAPSIPWSSTACPSRPRVRSMLGSMPAGSAARSCCCPGPHRDEFSHAATSSPKMSGSSLSK